MSNLFTAKEVCERLRITRSTFDGLIASGRLAVYRIGRAEGRGKILVGEGALEAFLESCRCEATPAPIAKGRGARLPLAAREDHFARFGRKRAK